MKNQENMNKFLTIEQQNLLHNQTGWSDNVISHIRSMEEAAIYMKAGLVERNIGGRVALIRKDINWSDFSCRHEWLKDRLADWKSWQCYNNADLIGEGYPPRDKNGDPYELHHIGQHQDSPYAELTWAEHRGDGNYAILHPQRESEIDRQEFTGEKSYYWQARFKLFTADELKRIYNPQIRN